MKGTYILLTRLSDNKEIGIGKRGLIHFEKGWYVYVGSALNSLEKRILRHMRSEKKMHWHIDYFLQFASIESVYYKEGNNRDECDVSLYLSRFFNGVDQFGCSDCSCKSHLYYSSMNDFIKYFENLDFCPFQV